MHNLHVLRRSSLSHRLAMRFSSSVLQRTFFERLRSLPGSDRFTLEHSIRYITAKAGISSSFSSRRRKSVLSRISQTLTNQPNSHDSSHGTQRILAHGFLPPSHRPPQLPTASGLSRVAFSAIKGLLGLIRVRGVLAVRAPSPLLIV